MPCEVCQRQHGSPRRPAWGERGRAAGSVTRSAGVQQPGMVAIFPAFLPCTSAGDHSNGSHTTHNSLLSRHSRLTAVGRVWHTSWGPSLRHVVLAHRAVLGGGRKHARSTNECSPKRWPEACAQGSAGASTQSVQLRLPPTWHGVKGSRSSLSDRMSPITGQQGWPGPPQSTLNLGTRKHFEAAIGRSSPVRSLLSVEQSAGRWQVGPQP